MNRVTNLPPWRRIPSDVRCCMCQAPGAHYCEAEWLGVFRDDGWNREDMLRAYACDGCAVEVTERFARIQPMARILRTPVQWSWSQWRDVQRARAQNKQDRLLRRFPMLAIVVHPRRFGRAQVWKLRQSLHDLRHDALEWRARRSWLQEPMDRVDDDGYFVGEDDD